ncbi:MAG TPA: preprotein translocase subunit SecG [Opitutae bacterium]|nr:preprotein translocase subunit SecG [Opitutaceae bacterium]HCR30701.1 preprotein translocase subunit SecG [Opitutae bacterium]
MSIIADILTIILVLISVFLILVVLMQKGNANGGMGAAMGGGMAEAALGAETSSVLTKVTRNTAIVFFVMVFGLGLAYIYLHSSAQEAEDNALPEFAAQEESGSGLLETISGAETTAEEAAESLEDQVEAAAQDAEAEAEQAEN